MNMSKQQPDERTAWYSSSALKTNLNDLNSLAAGVLSTLSQPVNQVWNHIIGKQEPLHARIVHRYAVPSSRTISVAEGFFGFIPIESYENEKYILEVAYGEQQYQVEVPRAYYQKSNIGDGIDIHTL